MDDRNAAHTDAFALFERLAQEILATPADGGSTHDRAERLWSLPDDLIYGYFGIVRDDDRAREQILVERLRRRAVALSATMPEARASAERRSEELDDIRERVAFRPWRPDDLDRYLACLDDPAVWEHFLQEYPDPITRELAASMIEAANETPDRQEVLAVAWDGEVVGQVWLFFDTTPEPDVAEIGCWLARPYWGRGYTTRFLKLYTHETFRKRPGLTKIVAEISRENATSLRLFGRIGYRREAFRPRRIIKAGRPVDTLITSIYRDDLL